MASLASGTVEMHLGDPSPSPDGSRRDRSARPRRRRRGWALVGLALFLAGLLTLGYVAWQFYGTNWVSHRKQAEVVESTQRSWQPGSAPDHERRGASALVRIPRFGADYVMPVLEGTSQEVLATGLGHFTGTAQVGRPGNYVIAGHRVTHGEPLRDMPRLRPRDKVVVETRDRVYTYELVTGGDSLRVPFTDGWVLAPVPRNPRAGGVEPPRPPGRHLITLVTCAELFHTDDRLVAFGVLLKSEPKERP